MQKPKIFKNTEEIGESGCCFRTCGGTPCILEYKKKTTKTEEKLLKIER